MKLVLERRSETPAVLNIFVPVGSLLAALAAGAIFLELDGLSAGTVYRDFVEASFTTWFGFTDTVALAIPLVLTGLAAAVTFRMNLFNIGAEGQLYAGAIGASWAGLALAPSLSPVLAALVILLFGAIGGALWILPAAIFRAVRGTNEIISTLMLTFVALFLMRWLIFGSKSYWRDQSSTNFPQGKRLALDVRLDSFGATRIHWGIAASLVAAVLVWVLLRLTRVGYDMDVVGASESAARYAGISVPKTMIGAFVLSGALAGLAGATEVGGRAYALDPNGLEVGLGFAGIVVASLARYNPLAVVAVALFIGGFRNAGFALQSTGVPAEVSTMLEGAVLLFAIGGEVFVRNRVRLIRPTSDVAVAP